MTSSRDRRRDFERAFPRGFFVDPEDVRAIESYAKSRGFLKPEETLRSVSRAGEGNMNLTLRLETSEGARILKQARPWVEKYPEIDAPSGRALVEIAFYETIASRPGLGGAMPKLLGRDPASGILVLEDLGEARDFTGLYRGDRIHPIKGDELRALVDYLVELHRPFPSPSPVFRNREMRALNHEHIFRLPLAPDNGLDLEALTPGLSKAADLLKTDGAYTASVRSLGELYLTDGPALVHGDYFPGSWLASSRGLRVIDPEFCFLGAAAFDLGVLLGHLYLARQPTETTTGLLRLYREAAGVGESFLELARQFAGVEIMRRLVGVAQLPLEADLTAKEDLLALSRRLVLLPETREWT